jgi:hypothetical protein
VADPQRAQQRLGFVGRVPARGDERAARADAGRRLLALQRADRHPVLLA